MATARRSSTRLRDQFDEANRLIISVARGIHNKSSRVGKPFVAMHR